MQLITKKLYSIVLIAIASVTTFGLSQSDAQTEDQKEALQFLSSMVWDSDEEREVAASIDSMLNLSFDSLMLLLHAADDENPKTRQIPSIMVLKIVDKIAELKSFHHKAFEPEVIDPIFKNFQMQILSIGDLPYREQTYQLIDVVDCAFQRLLEQENTMTDDQKALISLFTQACKEVGVRLKEMNAFFDHFPEEERFLKLQGMLKDLKEEGVQFDVNPRNILIFNALNAAVEDDWYVSSSVNADAECLTFSGREYCSTPGFSKRKITNLKELVQYLAQALREAEASVDHAELV